MGKKLLMFYGTECVHCHAMLPDVEKLEKELKVNVEKKEVWHNIKNLNDMRKVDKGVCTAVPYFFNEKTGNGICGAVPYAILKKWAKGK